MRFAIFSDLHDNLDAFYSLLKDAQRYQADRLIYLGDVGRELKLFRELQSKEILCTYGNWEVGALRFLTGGLQEWVAEWPATLHIGQAIYCHATPDMPLEATTTRAAARYMQGGSGWSGLFPRLHNNEDARWRAFAALEERDVRVAFHGHTHIQLAWAWAMSASGTRQVRSFAGVSPITLQVGNPQQPNRYLVGVGSAGQPNDGDQGKYAIYDDAAGLVELRSL